MIFVSAIQRATAAEYDLPFAVMREPRPIGKTRANSRPVSRPRQVAIYISSCLTRHTYSRIGDLFGGRDHSTVLYSIRMVKSRLASDKEVQAAVRRIARTVLS